MTGEPVIVVDDNRINAKLLEIVLGDEGFDVRTASDAEEALALLQTFRPRLIMMDLRLPGMHGLELTRRLKADAATRDIIIIAVTSSAMKGDYQKALAAGCDGYVTKPISTVSLPRLVARHLAIGSLT
jgi:two-component system cell cycle response regulator DivK